MDRSSKFHLSPSFDGYVTAAKPREATTLSILKNRSINLKGELLQQFTTHMLRGLC